MMSQILKFARSTKTKLQKKKISGKRNVVFPSNKKIALVYSKVYIMVKVVF